MKTKKIIMNNELVKYFNNKMDESFKNLYISYMKTLKNESENFKRTGLITCGNSQPFLIEKLNKLLTNLIESTIDVISNTETEFNDCIPIEVIYECTEKCKNIVEHYSKDITKDVKNILKDSLIDGDLSESSINLLNSYKCQNVLKIEQIYNDQKLIASGKKIDESITLSKKANLISIWSLIIAIIGIIVSVVLFFIK